ncbi:MAG: hypothetical protein ACRCXZ_01440 [Patescibacteria group bacterium]
MNQKEKDAWILTLAQNSTIIPSNIEKDSKIWKNIIDQKPIVFLSRGFLCTIYSEKYWINTYLFYLSFFDVNKTTDLSKLIDSLNKTYQPLKTYQKKPQNILLWITVLNFFSLLLMLFLGITLTFFFFQNIDKSSFIYNFSIYLMTFTIFLSLYFSYQLYFRLNSNKQFHIYTNTINLAFLLSGFAMAFGSIPSQVEEAQIIDRNPSLLISGLVAIVLFLLIKIYTFRHLNKIKKNIAYE